MVAYSGYLNDVTISCFAFMAHSTVYATASLKYRLYTEVKVSTGFIKPRAFGPRFFDKSSRNRTEVYNRLLP